MRTQLQDDTLRKELKISNVICTADLKQRVDLTKFVNFDWGIYDSTTYGGRCGYVKLAETQGKVTVFANGKMISLGAKSIKLAIRQLDQAKFYLTQANLVSNITLEPKIQNIVSMTNLGQKIHVEMLARVLPKSMYEPEQFAALIYRVYGSVVALIFTSGKVILVGAKTIKDLNNAFFELKQRIDSLK